MSKESAEAFKQLMAERATVPLTNRERWLVLLLPTVASFLHLNVSGLNGEGYKLKVKQYWRLLLVKYLVLFALVMCWAYLLRFVEWYALPLAVIRVYSGVTVLYLCYRIGGWVLASIKE